MYGSAHLTAQGEVTSTAASMHTALVGFLQEISIWKLRIGYPRELDDGIDFAVTIGFGSVECRTAANNLSLVCKWLLP